MGKVRVLCDETQKHQQAGCGCGGSKCAPSIVRREIRLRRRSKWKKPLKVVISTILTLTWIAARAPRDIDGIRLVNCSQILRWPLVSALIDAQWRGFKSNFSLWVLLLPLELAGRIKSSVKLRRRIPFGIEDLLRLVRLSFCWPAMFLSFKLIMNGASGALSLFWVLALSRLMRSSRVIDFRCDAGTAVVNGTRLPLNVLSLLLISFSFSLFLFLRSFFFPFPPRLLPCLVGFSVCVSGCSWSFCRMTWGAFVTRSTLVNVFDTSRRICEFCSGMFMDGFER